MEKKKVKGQETFVTGVIMICAMMAFIGGYVLSSDLKDRIFRATEASNSEDENALISSAGGTLGGATLGFNEKNVVSEEEKDYNVYLETYMGMDGTYTDIQYGQNKSQLIFKTYSYENETSKETIVNFPANVVDTHLSTFDLDSKLNTIFVLLEDGKVDYILIEDALEKDDIRTYGTLEINNVAKFYEGTTCEKNTDECVKTAFAQTMDGKIYDLYDFVK